MSTSNGSGGKDRPTAHAQTAVSSPDAGAGVVPVAYEGTTPLAVDPLIGQTVAGRYLIISLLGRGGMGSVYVCEHIQLKKKMALKMLAEELRRQPALVSRFLKEARAAAQIGHPNIVDVYDLGELPGGGAYIAMAMLEGEDLQSELERSGAVPVARARLIVGEICRALAAAHSKGIIHRDMKPANVFLARDGDGREQVKVLDFGIAQVNEPTGEEARLTQTGAIVGTPAFMSPEQGRGERPDHRTDVYSVGCILYNLVTGTVPFEGNTLMGVITRHLFDPPVPPSQRRPEAGIPPEMDAVVLRAMAKAPADRFQTMKEMWTALEAASAGTPLEWPDATSGRYEKLPGATPVPPPRAAPPAPARRGPWLALLGAVLGSLVVAVVALRPWKTATPTPTPAPTATAPPTAPARAEVTLEVRSTPAGATVWQGEKALGKTPLRLTRPRSDEEITLHVAAEGYSDETLSMTLDRDRLVDVRMHGGAPAPEAPRPVEPTGKAAHDGKAHDAAHRPVIKKAGRAGDLKNPFAQ